MIINGKGQALLSVLMTVLVPMLAAAQNQDVYTYKPPSQALYNEIVHMDSVYFNAYNSCDMATQAALYSDSIEFYHDKGGLETNKQKLLDAIQKNICGKVTRVLVSGSIEVYPIGDYGAVEIGLHQNDRWRISRVISLH